MPASKVFVGKQPASLRAGGGTGSHAHATPISGWFPAHNLVTDLDVARYLESFPVSIDVVLVDVHDQLHSQFRQASRGQPLGIASTPLVTSEVWAKVLRQAAVLRSPTYPVEHGLLGGLRLMWGPSAKDEHQAEVDNSAANQAFEVLVGEVARSDIEDYAVYPEFEDD